MGEGIQEVQIHYKINNSLGCNMQPGNYSDSSESRSVVSDSLQPHRLYSPWNSPGQNTGVGHLSLLQGIFPTQGSNLVSCIAGRFFTFSATREDLILCTSSTMT